MESDNELAVYERRLRDLENELADSALRLELSRSIAELHEHPSWKKLVDRIKTIEQSETARMMYGRMDSYDLGRRQGRLLVLRYLTSEKPMGDDEVAKLREAATFTQDRITEYRNLLN